MAYVAHVVIKLQYRKNLVIESLQKKRDAIEQREGEEPETEQNLNTR